MEVEYSFTSSRVIELLKRVIEWRGKPQEIRSDNGPEFIAKAFGGFCENSEISHVRIQKGKPNQNGYVERFNRTYREDILDANIFENVGQVRELTLDWMDDYNNNHPHASLGNMSPKEFMQTKYEKYLSLLTL